MAIIYCRDPREIAKEKKTQAWTQAYADQREERHGMSDKELQLTAVWRLFMERHQIGKGK